MLVSMDKPNDLGMPGPHSSLTWTQETYPTSPTRMSGMTLDTHKFVALLIDAFGAIE